MFAIVNKDNNKHFCGWFLSNPIWENMVSAITKIKYHNWGDASRQKNILKQRYGFCNLSVVEIA